MPVPLPPGAKRVFHGVLHDIWQWEQELFDGSTTTFECMTRQDTVSVVAFVDPETVLLLEEEQPGRTPFQGMPGGRVEPDEQPEVAARREFEEETGYATDELTLFRSSSHEGSARFTKYIFLAKNVKPLEGGQRQDVGERVKVAPTPWKDVVAMALNNQFRSQEDMVSILTLEFGEEGRAFKKDFLA